MRIIFLLTAIAVSAGMFANEKLYTGTVGKYRITVSVDQQATAINAGYFYYSKKVIIPLSAKVTNDSLYLTYKTQQGVVGESFAMKSNTDGSFSGSWTGPKNKVLPVNLQPAQIETPDNDFIGDGSLPLLNKLTKSKQAIVLQKTTTINGVTLEYYEFLGTEIDFIRLKSGVKDQVMKQINDNLWKSAVDAQSLGSEAVASGGEFIFAANNVYVKGNIVSICASENSYVPGTAHPSVGTRTYNYLLVNGNKVELRDLFFFGELHNFDDYGANMAKFIKKTFAKQMAADTDCDYTDEAIWQYAGFTLTPAGIQLLPEFPHVSFSCSYPEWCIVPYNLAKPYIRPGSGITY